MSAATDEANAPEGTAVVIGARGGIGAALVGALRAEDSYRNVIAMSRSDCDHPIDVCCERSIAAAADRTSRLGAPLRLVIVATGLLHQGDGPADLGPEKALSQVDPAWMALNFAVNAQGPLVIAKHFVPLLAREGRSVFAALGARVGSIADNQAGGWISYRMAKAALVMGLKSVAIEQRRRAPGQVIVTLHPGTVETNLSAPFGRNLPHGQKVSADVAALRLLDVIDELTPGESGRHISWDGSVIPG